MNPNPFVPTHILVHFRHEPVLVMALSKHIHHGVPENVNAHIVRDLPASTSVSYLYPAKNWQELRPTTWTFDPSSIPSSSCRMGRTWYADGLLRNGKYVPDAKGIFPVDSVWLLYGGGAVGISPAGQVSVLQTPTHTKPPETNSSDLLRRIFCPIDQIPYALAEAARIDQALDDKPAD